MRQAAHIQIDCSITVRNILCEALRNYASYALADSHSARSLMSRLALMRVVKSIESQRHNRFNPLQIRRELHNQCIQAINHHYDRIEKQLKTPVSEQRRLMISLLNGHSVLDHDLDAAIYKDNLI